MNDTHNNMRAKNDGTKRGASDAKSASDDVKENVKQRVADGEAVAGALKGFSEEAHKHDLAGSAKQAVQKAGETTREIAGTAKKEFQQTRDHLTRPAESASGATTGVGASAPNMAGGGTSGDKMGAGSAGSTSAGSTSSAGSTTRSCGSSSSPSSVPDLRKTALGTQGDIKERSGLSGSLLGSDEDDSTTTR